LKTELVTQSRSLSSVGIESQGPLTLLFDLDGTLIQMEEKWLELRFMLKAIPRFASIIRPWRFRQAFWEAARLVQQNSSSIDNFSFYIDVLSNYAYASPEKVERVAREAIEQDFASIQGHFEPFPGARDTLTLARQQGHRLVVATNPMIPLSGVMTRLNQGGFSDIPFDYITNAEVMTRTKPKVEYYEELLERLLLDPSRCLMVGNDPNKDLPAKDAGISTFLLDVPKISPLSEETKNDKRLDFFGSYTDLQNLLIEREKTNE